MISMGDFDKHLDIAKEKLRSVVEAYKRGDNSVVGDLSTKVIEQLIEADAARENKHFGSHAERHEFSGKSYPEDINKASKLVWFAYGDLGYDGGNGKRAKSTIIN